MKYLTNLSVSTSVQKWFADDWGKIEGFLQKNNLDGLELMLNSGYDLQKIPKKYITGMHFNYWPIWLDFWRGNQDALLKQFGQMEDVHLFYGGQDKQALVDYYRQELEAAQELDVKYVVFHVAHVELLHTYTWEFTYSDQEVLTATAELVNQVFGSEDKGMTLLFENLWWPGLKLNDAHLAQSFLAQVTYPNKGFMLDIGHMMITNPQLQQEEQACQYILATLKRLGDLKKHIKGIHLNKSLSGTYLMEDHTNKINSLNTKSKFWDKIWFTKDHIEKIDCHVPFDHPAIKDVIAEINPEYLVFELLAESLAQFEQMIRRQKSFLV